MGCSAPECTFGGLQASQGNSNNKIVAKRLPNKTKNLLPKFLYAFIPFLLSFFTLGTLRSNDGDGNENIKKTIGLISKTRTLHVHHAFCTFLFPFLHDYDVNMPNFAFYRGRKQATKKFYFSYCTWIWCLGIQLQEGSPTFDKVSV